MSIVFFRKDPLVSIDTRGNFQSSYERIEAQSKLLIVKEDMKLMFLNL